MWRFILMRRVFKGWNRQFTTKRERVPSSLQECLDTPAPRRRIWRQWFILLVVVPLLYYLIFVRPGYQDGMVNSEESLPVAEDLVSSIVNVSNESKLPENSIRSGIIRNELQSLTISSKKLYTIATTNNPAMRVNMPYCLPKHTKGFKAVTVNITDVMSYQRKLTKGGLHWPKNCKPRHKVALLVPYRDRSTNLAVFLYNMHPFLINQGLEYRIFIVEQSGKELFNRGRLFNAGFVEMQKYGVWDCVVFHDVDLLPSSTRILYTCPTWPRHMSSTILGITDPSFQSYFGGVTSMILDHYKKVNGYSNLYWGWGGEDTDMFWRIRISGLVIMRYSTHIAKYISLPHVKTPANPIRALLTRNAGKRMRKDGLSSIKYKLLTTTLYQTYTHFVVDINPDKENITVFFRTWGN